jgi:1,4-dihydroxy-2-naphthoate octaprenyltransferase
MTRKIFFDLVEIRTKLASFFPFLIAVLFTNTYFHSFHWGKTLCFFFGMIAFDMATTAINNYMDFRKAHSEEYKYQENIIGKAQLSERTVVMIIFGLIGFSAIVGITLAIQTGWLLLVMGCACCFIGVFYTFGPIPLSRMPLGEVFSGVTMGLGIFAITVYLNTYDKKLFSWSWICNILRLLGVQRRRWRLSGRQFH